MTRKRVRSQVGSYLKEKCPICEGEGMVYSTEYIYRRLRNNIERVLRHIKVGKIYIKGNDKVVKIAEKKEIVKFYKEKFNVDVEVVVDNNKKYGHFEIEFE